jgi:hypothetical protein
MNTPTMDQVKELIRKHAPRISRTRMVVLLAIATAFVWVLMGARRGDAP